MKTVTNPIVPQLPTGHRIVLASNSPRRRELLGMIVPEFTIADNREVDETFDPELAAEQVPVELSKLKSAAFADLVDDETVLITADTVVIVDGRILGKPHDAEEAHKMLNEIQGRAHKVVTGVTLRTKETLRSFAETTIVHFNELTPRQIDDYILAYAPFDKAGAYGIQEWVGGVGIRGVEGCFYNVMGLPLSRLYRELCDLG